MIASKSFLESIAIRSSTNLFLCLWCVIQIQSTEVTWTKLNTPHLSCASMTSSLRTVVGWRHHRRAMTSRWHIVCCTAAAAWRTAATVGSIKPCRSLSTLITYYKYCVQNVHAHCQNSELNNIRNRCNIMFVIEQ